MAHDTFDELCQHAMKVVNKWLSSEPKHVLLILAVKPRERNGRVPFAVYKTEGCLYSIAVLFEQGIEHLELEDLITKLVIDRPLVRRLAEYVSSQINLPDVECWADGDDPCKFDKKTIMFGIFDEMVELIK
jgi:hypothetical protein